MGKKENLNKAKDIYAKTIEQICNDKNKWKEFLEFSSKFYKYSFTENLLMFGQNKDVSMCATLEEWNSIGRWIKPHSVGIKILRDTESNVQLDYVFDVKDTYARKNIPNAYTDKKLENFKWSATEEQTINIFKDYFNYEDTDTLEDIIARYVATEIDASELLLNLSDKEEQECLKPEFFELLIKNTKYQVANRCKIETKDIETIFEGYEKIANPTVINILGNCINHCSSELLRIIEYKIKQIKREELSNENIREIWNKNQEKSKGTLSNKVQSINNRNNINGEIIGERGRNTETERDNGKATEGTESGTKDTRISSDGNIQQNDTRESRGIVTTNVRRENLEDDKEVEKTTSFSLPENNQLGFETLFNLSYQQNEDNFKKVTDEKQEEQEIIDNKINYNMPKQDEKLNARQRANANIQAIKLLKLIESEKRLATEDEQKILAKYSGWGGLSKVFDSHYGDWQVQQIDTENNLTEDEYAEAKASVVNSFYTNPVIIDNIYLGLQRLGFKKGNILEPSTRNR